MNKRTFSELKIEDYLNDNPEFQKGYLYEALNEYFEDGDLSAFLYCLKPLIKVRFGSVSNFAKKTGLNRTYYYKLFKNEITPDFAKVLMIVKELGFNIQINLVPKTA